ncbi:MAG TPA: thiamine-phosphate kinase [Nitrospirota bacterium]|nr:thiamine-phosphate kinase [Nitrospirota bacterium]
MKLSSLGEFGLIDSIQKMAARQSPSVLIGMGDDAAALKIATSSILLATTDMLLEDVHFDLSYTDYYSLGWKSAAVNLSDIAAMGGIPRFCLTSLGIPSSVSVEQVKDFYLGFSAILRSYRVLLVGGDTCLSREKLVVNVVMLGESEKARIVSRAGAEPGDKIFVTGTLGDSAAGLELLRTRACHKKQGPWERKLTQKHLRPKPRVEWGIRIARSRCAHAMIDISDGLSSDLAHICEQSRVGAKVYSEDLPCSRSLHAAENELGKTPMHYALSGGEDYELLFTASPRCGKKLKSLGVPLFEIGEITRTRKLVLVDGQGITKPLVPGGYDHFLHS